jgi:Tfp pilus assembly protein PilV
MTRDRVVGFTLIELLVALVVVQIGVLGSLSLMVLARRTVTRAEQLERAAAVAAGLADSLSMAAAVDSVVAQREGLRVTWFGDPARFEVKVFAQSGDSIHLVGSSSVGLRGR